MRDLSKCRWWQLCIAKIGLYVDFLGDFFKRSETLSPRHTTGGGVCIYMIGENSKASDFNIYKKERESEREHLEHREFASGCTTPFSRERSSIILGPVSGQVVNREGFGRTRNSCCPEMQASASH
jgi:hypothetical protein